MTRVLEDPAKNGTVNYTFQSMELKMINIMSFKTTKGYEQWKRVFESEKMVNVRVNFRVNVLAYGLDEQSERVYIVQEMESMEVFQIGMADPEIQAAMREAGIDMATMQAIPLKH